MPGSTLGRVIRSALAAVLLVLLLPVVVVANTAEWAARTVVDDAAFTGTVERVMDAPALRLAIAQRVTDEVTAHLALDPAALALLTTDILQLPSTTSLYDVRTALRARIATAMDDPAVRQARDAAISAVHAELNGLLAGQDGAVKVRGSDLVLDTGPILTRVATSIDARLTPFVADLPAADRDIVLARADSVVQAGDALSALEIVQSLVPLASILVVFAILGLAHRRVRALGLVGIAVTAAGAVTLVAAWVGGAAVGGASSDITVREVTTEVYAAFVSVLARQAALLIVGGLVVAVVAWAVLRSRRGMSPPSHPSGTATTA